MTRGVVVIFFLNAQDVSLLMNRKCNARTTLASLDGPMCHRCTTVPKPLNGLIYFLFLWHVTQIPKRAQLPCGGIYNNIVAVHKTNTEVHNKK